MVKAQRPVLVPHIAGGNRGLCPHRLGVQALPVFLAVVQKALRWVKAGIESVLDIDTAEEVDYLLIRAVVDISKVGIFHRQSFLIIHIPVCVCGFLGLDCSGPAPFSHASRSEILCRMDFS